MTDRLKPPTANGLYDPTYEHDACGVALVARLDNVASHEVVEKALLALENLEHRGAAGGDPAADARPFPARGRRLCTAPGRAVRRGHVLPAHRSRAESED